ncbi:magnesium transporter CorA family protein [Actinomadura alba]|uniref:Magnesium transporter CorA family protein n=1 Tax=Actinomadura alba TaxID=406431 RepID=A0ABR7LYY3_9ACTN|nr:magnesium transporter CorA family protein [Actinomadura alba]MBC6469707.1 magnesium transporter CorA family protein [Actinomadura alba]
MGESPRKAPATQADDRIGTHPPRTRLWRDGRLEAEGFPVAEISEHLAEPDTVVWLDLCGPRDDELRVVSDELGLDAFAIEDAVSRHERAKLDRYPGHLFLNAYDARLDSDSGRLETTEVSAFITERAVVTVRQEPTFDVDELIRRWDADGRFARYGVAFLLHGLLDMLVDRHFDAVQDMDGRLDDLEGLLFDEHTTDRAMQRYSFELRKSLVLLRRVVLPMREIVNTLMRRDLEIVPEAMTPFYQDVYDHVLRATEWTESLRDLVTTIQETRIALQGNRLNEVMKQVTSWAAIIAVPTAVTGFYGMNVPYPGFGEGWGVVTALAVLVITGAGLYVIFKRRDWL